MVITHASTPVFQIGQCINARPASIHPPYDIEHVYVIILAVAIAEDARACLDAAVPVTGVVSIVD